METEFDYFDMFRVFLDKKTLKIDIEEYINNMNSAGKYLNCFRITAKYYDERMDTTLLLFIYRGVKLHEMQLWELKGICSYNDYDEEFEDSGVIRAWLNTKLFEGDD